MPNLVAQNHLHDIDVSEIALCKQGAVPKATILVKKAIEPDSNKEQFAKELHMIAKDDVKKQVFFYPLVPDEPDHQGDLVKKSDIEAAQLSFGKNLSLGLQKGQGTSDTHSNFGDIGYVFESAIDVDGSIAKSHGVPVEKCVPGGWWVGVQCTDTSWDKVQKGEFNAASIGGQGARTPIQQGTEKALLEKVVDGIGTILKHFGVTKAEGDPITFSAALAARQTNEKLWDLEDALWKAVRSILKSTAANKPELISQTVDQFKAALMAFVSQLPTTGAEMTKALSSVEEIVKAHDTAITEKARNNPGEGDTAVGKNEEIVKQLGEIQKSMNALTDKLEKKEPVADPKPEVAKTDPPKADDSDAAILKAVEGLKTTMAALDAKLEKALALPAGKPGSEESEGAETVTKSGPRSPFNFGGGGPKFDSK